jgi:NAD(P)-dependent dehydrogenase (short-subunit alcohol dehydrogenase family)
MFARGAAGHAQGALFLASEASGFITGQVINADGGATHS